MGLVDRIKEDVKKAGANKGKFIYFREGTKTRIRFLNDMNDGMEVTFHDSFQSGINVPCQTIFGRECPYCDDEDLRTRSQYIWSVWDYEAKEVKLFMFPVNNCSPVPALMSMYDTYGTLTDRDYVISVEGKQRNKTFTVVPMDKVKFRNTKAKPYSKAAILKMLDKAYPSDVNGAQIADVDEDTPTDDYDSMSPKALYNLCVERDLEVEKRKPAQYYITILRDDDKVTDDWGDDEETDDDTDDWDDTDEWEDE